MVAFEDIFSSKPLDKEVVPSLGVVVDTREKQSLVPSFLRSLKLSCSFETLEVGDYLVGDVLVERKTFSDLVSSILNRRIFVQLKSLVSHPCPLLLVEGFDYKYASYGIHENALRSFLLSVVSDYKVPLVYTKDASDTAKFLFQLARRCEKQGRLSSKRVSRKSLSFRDRCLFVLEGFPGIGPSLAVRLFDRFGSLEKVFSASKSDLLGVEKFDERKVDMFLSLLKG